MDQATDCFFLGIDREYYQLMGLPNMTGTPERRLLLAILERAILDYVGNDEREFEQAEHWLFSEAGRASNDFFSFNWVCEQLDLDPTRIANKIRAMPRRGNRKVAPWYFMKTETAAA
jgi:hypothetical protein